MLLCQYNGVLEKCSRPDHGGNKVCVPKKNNDLSCLSGIVYVLSEVFPIGCICGVFVL